MLKEFSPGEQGQEKVTWGEIKQSLLGKIDRVRSGETPFMMLCWYMPFTNSPFTDIETQKGWVRMSYGHIERFLRYGVAPELKYREETEVEVKRITRGRDRGLRVYWFAIKPGPLSWQNEMKIKYQTSLLKVFL